MIIDPNRAAEMTVGQPIKMVCAYATAVIQCQCDAKPIFALHGKQPGMCPACQRMYVIVSGGQITIGMPMPEGVA